MGLLESAISAVGTGAKATWDTSKVVALAAGGTIAGGAALGYGAFRTARATGYHGFKLPGHLTTWGWNPETVLDKTHGEWAGATRLRGWGGFFDVTAEGDIRGSWTPEAASHMGKGFSWQRLKAHAPGNALGLGMNAFFMYQGYKENGLSGAYDAMALNVAIEASLFKWGYGVGLANKVGSGFMNPNTKMAGHPLKLGVGMGIMRGLGAGVSGYIGQQLGLATGIPMAGTIGAAAGAYIGGAPLQAMRANPILVGGTMAALGTAAVTYGAYSVVKTAGRMGFAHRQAMRGVNTDGDMSAFMTQNAMTMRERSVQAIAKSHLNARSALGQEANFMHSPRNYNSRYR